MIFVELDEITESDRKPDFPIGIEGIESQRILQPGDDQCEAQRIKARIQKLQIIGQMRKFSFLFRGNLLELRANGSSERHDGSPIFEKNCVRDLTQWRALSPMPRLSRCMSPVE
jgi:hypothetical protein